MLDVSPADFTLAETTLLVEGVWWFWVAFRLRSTFKSWRHVGWDLLQMLHS